MGLQRVGHTEWLSLIHWCRWHHPYGRMRNQRSLLMKVKEESEKTGWTQHSKTEDHGIWSHHFKANIGKNGNSDRLYFGGLQNHCRWWLQPWNQQMLAPWKKTVTNLDSILKIRDITLPTTVCLVKVMVFPVVMYGCESWTIKKAEELMLLYCCVGENSWESQGLQGDQTSQSYRKSILNIHWKGWCWSWSSNSLATWCKEPTH